LHQYSLKRTHLAKSLYLRWKGRTISETVAAWHYTSPNEAAESWPPGNRRQFVLGNGVEPNEFALDRNLARDRVAARWPQLAGFRYILFMARLHPKKRVDLLLKAFLAAELVNFKLVVAGPDEEHLWEPLSRRLLARSTDRDRVLRLGTVVGDAKRQLLAGAAAFALPSEHENFGTAVLESLAAGTPALVSPHVDWCDAIAAARCGTTVPLEPLKWTEQLMALASRPEPSEQFVTSCRDWVSANYSWERIASRLQHHYQELQSHRDGSAA
jgi:glycosyltransferase involved in cell wall biosynthesis